ncbi:DUF302 domain-containing protein [Denitromonas iodatirespirans]|uniref:DUF302 domain-containing protein n=1 Tax=Denitromonas iodatirespirans TaxID=2795389 RepID=A0A944H5X9_DENI1|nr:DUF302 domain-containing protein [Denitromonas iodatirespirans]MBT0959588.1 DUF302 domain-containing protein [Denitromonas iodatirespirans]
MKLFIRSAGLRRLSLAAAALTLSLGLLATAASAAPPAVTTVASAHDFDTLVSRLEAAIARHQMGLVAQASASHGAAARGVKIPGNAVLMVFRNDYAMRMLAASVPAGIEAPLRLYVTERPDGSAQISYPPPSTVFAPYGNAELDAMARELDPVFAQIVADAVAP